MPKLHRKTDGTGGHGCFVPNASSQGSPNVFCNGLPVTRIGDLHVGHDCPPVPLPFHRTAYVQGSPNVFCNGAAVVRVGDATSCGDPAIAGSPNVEVN